MRITQQATVIMNALIKAASADLHVLVINYKTHKQTKLLGEMLVDASNSRIKPQDDLYAELSKLDDKLSRSCGHRAEFCIFSGYEVF